MTPTVVDLFAGIGGLSLGLERAGFRVTGQGAPHVRKRLFVVAYPHCLDGPPRLRPDLAGGLQAVQRRRDTARAWRDQVTWSVEAARADDRDADGSAARVVEAAGNAVVPAVAEHIGRMICAHIAASQPGRAGRSAA